MTEEQFCKNDSAFDGEPVDSIKQIAFRSFNGHELKEYVEHHISMFSDSIYLMKIDREATVVVADNIADAMDKAEYNGCQDYEMIYCKTLPVIF